MNWYRRWGKRLFDVLAAASLLVICLPVITLVAGASLIAHGWPVLFVQRRPGLHGRPFSMYKFRTMKDTKDESGRLLPDHLRTTPFGRFARRSSIDELPELFNVLRGDMSLVGPRPLLMEYLALYSPQQARRHEVRPGITGLAQVRGRNSLSWPEKFALDVEYVDTYSFTGDVAILLLTVTSVISARGVNASETVTMPPFTGKEDRGAVETKGYVGDA